MDQKIVRTLESDIEKAIAEILLRRAKGWFVPLLPSQPVMHLMAKAAVSVFEAAVEATASESRSRMNPEA